MSSGPSLRLVSRSMARLREYFSLAEAERRSAARSPENLAAMAELIRAGRNRLGAARELREPPRTAASLILYREAAECFLAAWRIALADGALYSGPQTAVPSLSAALEEGASQSEDAADAQAARRLVMGLLDRDDPVAVDRLSALDAERAVALFERVNDALTTALDARTPAEIRRVRWIRRSVAVFATTLAFVAVTLRALSPRDIARGKPVHASPAAYATQAGGAVDGVTTGRFGYHSVEEEGPSLVVDLQKSYALSRVRVLGRSDCCFEQSIPLDLDVSADGVSYSTIARRAEGFSQMDPWVVQAGGAVARFVRLRVDRRAVLVVTEIEVYGKESRRGP